MKYSFLNVEMLCHSKFTKNLWKQWQILQFFVLSQKSEILASFCHRQEIRKEPTSHQTNEPSDQLTNQTTNEPTNKSTN